MKRGAPALLKEALALPAGDRAALAEALLASLDGDVDEHADAVRAREFERRIAGLDGGGVSTIPWPEVRQRLFERARLHALKRLRDGFDLEWTPASSREDLHRP